MIKVNNYTGIKLDKIRFLNPDDFKKWMKKQDCKESSSTNDMAGMTVEAKHSSRKTAQKITLEEGRPDRVVREFVRFGGIVKKVDGDEYLVEVESGSFYINKKFVV